MHNGKKLFSKEDRVNNISFFRKKYHAVPADKATLQEIAMERIRGMVFGISESTI